jgi:hypothetical protein
MLPQLLAPNAEKIGGCPCSGDLGCVSPAASELIRFAQPPTLAELRGQPLILLGSFCNDWAVRLGSDLRYTLRQMPGAGVNHGLGWIEDVGNPGDRRWTANFDAPFDQATTDDALVTRAFERQILQTASLRRQWRGSQ